ncbi:ribosome assembly cofactor RimP [Mycoplasmopsis pullorum]|uniref:ribosome assembly cofactor RimP n=1 Tax=Mycoplasmopsis pullorum TaxID=48003 RepID=UPI00111BC3B8|nr:ribosome assembly cofactor RimP [Mycoplasmopsis pullorum]TNK83621.1 ribosome assembly cofactor RimP [Mycoplasmopsis pullorum]TNK86475.1 ribosome assembly cofactor RimP [Mycoplasmopsis pullorum]TNK87754.1 ribosome assembly cofactor RimP [Mycoplasmopsis pullorum]TNK88498.1 ribosome assembly cofactor RimP [Mycoplasmopsis pullorum]TNK88615.1 ribosome assembly cofactor RimP [Mycoplasmopsis pullorum]
MDYKKILKDEFGDIIISAKLVADPIELVKSSLNNTLEIVLNTQDLNEVEKYSKLFIEYLDNQTWFKDEWNLSVLSKGVETNISLDDVENYINQKLKFFLDKAYLTHNIFVGEVLEVLENEILIKWNDHGQFRKIKLDKNNLNKIELYIKF